jgi:uncharacterized protein
MSQAEIEQLRAVYDAVSRGDWDDAFRDAGPDFEFVPPDQNPMAGTYRGREAVRGFFDELWAAFDAVSVEPGPFLEAGDRIVVSLVMKLRPSDSPASIEMPITHVWTMRDGKPARCEVFLEREQALETLGISDRAMSQENVEIVRGAYDAFNRAGVDEFLEHLHPDAEYDITAAIGPYAGMYYGRTAIRHFLAEYFESWEYVRMEPEELIEADQEHVVVLLHMHMRGKGSGAAVDAHPTNVWTVRGGKAVRIAVYNDKAEALEAVRVTE